MQADFWGPENRRTILLRIALSLPTPRRRGPLPLLRPGHFPWGLSLGSVLAGVNAGGLAHRGSPLASCTAFPLLGRGGAGLGLGHSGSWPLSTPED